MFRGTDIPRSTIGIGIVTLSSGFPITYSALLCFTICSVWAICSSSSVLLWLAMMVTCTLCNENVGRWLFRGIGAWWWIMHRLIDRIVHMFVVRRKVGWFRVWMICVRWRTVHRLIIRWGVGWFRICVRCRTMYRLVIRWGGRVEWFRVCVGWRNMHRLIIYWGVVDSVSWDEPCIGSLFNGWWGLDDSRPVSGDESCIRISFWRDVDHSPICASLQNNALNGVLFNPRVITTVLELHKSKSSWLICCFVVT